MDNNRRTFLKNAALASSATAVSKSISAQSASDSGFQRIAVEETFSVPEVLDAMRADSGVELSSLRVDGGMVVNELLMQFQADVLGVPVVRPVVEETTALGAAFAAGLAEGYWDGLDDLRANWQEGGRWEPTLSEGERDALLARWSDAVTRTFDWA